ncbi:hypothetical protein IPR92_19430 [Xanthomonas perforans]|uniref:hypothetical protein n=2 Tax=Xanthomonas TaxID=338 RepID=UPI00062D2D92|nr:hypothetical protein [Xanthomonas perforans]KLC64097.1 hypothetical protein GEV872_04315 [Xanthomonas perforans]KLC68849.1 hypothetical protein GEV893_10245 [Xanthomonas perforans]KLC72517.1 hypothetical protein GEV909_17920 [Xanthomonas perforans]KLC80191.1 hypothetical protein GEV915_12005 [Xanthomonas perforans]KLC80768.1 hypothetical protein GEV904_05000 [Xanthomonas perforans]
MSKAAEMRMLRDERCNPVEIATALNLPVKRVQRFLQADAQPKFHSHRNRTGTIARAFRGWRGQSLGGVVISL